MKCLSEEIWNLLCAESIPVTQHPFSPQEAKGKLSELSTYSHVVAVGGKFRIYFRKCISETDGGCVPLSLWTTSHGTLIPYPSDGHYDANMQKP